MSNWREEYKQFTRNKKELDLLENGPKSLAQSWHMQAMYNQWKRIKGISDDNPQLATPFPVSYTHLTLPTTTPV